MTGHHHFLQIHLIFITFIAQIPNVFEPKCFYHYFIKIIHPHFLIIY
jgi:hypothetical protein